MNLLVCFEVKFDGLLHVLLEISGSCFGVSQPAGVEVGLQADAVMVVSGENDVGFHNI